MANDATRTVRVRFDGSTKGLEAASKRAMRQMDAVERHAEKFGTKGGGFLAPLSNLPKLVGDAFSAIPAEAKLVIGAAGAAAALIFAAPMGAAISAAVLLGLGGGIIAAGIAAAARDPAVKAAWAKVGLAGQNIVSDVGARFSGPVQRAAGVVVGLLERLRPQIDVLAQMFAPVVDKLVPVFTQMVETIFPSLSQAAIASLPLFDMLAEKGPKIAGSIADFFSVIAENGPAAELFFGRLLDGVSRLIGFFTTIIDVLGRVYQASEDVWTMTRRNIDTVVNALSSLRNNTVGIFDGLWQSFRASLNRIVNAWNRLEFRIGGGSIFGMDIPQFTLSTPNIPTFHTGGIVPGQGDQLINAKGGEGVFTKEQMKALGDLAAPEIHVYIGDRELKDMVRVEIGESNRSTRRLVLAGAGAR